MGKLDPNRPGDLVTVQIGYEPRIGARNNNIQVQRVLLDRNTSAKINKYGLAAWQIVALPVKPSSIHVLTAPEWLQP